MVRLVCYRLLVVAAALTVIVSAGVAGVQAGLLPPPSQWAQHRWTTTGLSVSPSPTPTSQAPQVRLVVLPHPGDELQVWSQVENRPGSFTVFVYLTQGERNPACQRDAYRAGFQPRLGEVEPTPWPVVTNPADASGCQNAHISSAVGFLNAMGQADRSLPTGLAATSTVQLPADTVMLSRCLHSECVAGDSSVRVYAPPPGADGVPAQPGMALFFNLGDGDLDSMEASWAIRSVITRRQELGIPLGYPVASIVGTFYNTWGYKACSAWGNPDNLALHRALFRDNFGVSGAQSAATCASDTDATLTRVISGSAWRAAMAMGPRSRVVDGQQMPVRVGAYQRFYGWMDAHAGGFPAISNPRFQQPRTPGAAIPLMRRQSFWQTWIGAAQTPS